ncbi:MAG: SIMPL domain-containing protein [Candidatus Krumholzibacteriia bacterium]
MRNHVIAASILGLCFVAGTGILAHTWRGNVNAAQTLKVTGSAKLDLVSDLARLRLTVEGNGATAEAAWKDLQRQLPLVLGSMREQGVPDQAVERFPANSWSMDEFDSRGNRTGRVLSWTTSQDLQIEIADVELAKRLSLDLSGLVTEGVSVRLGQPEYLYLDLAAVKEEVQAMAAEDAMRRAQKVAAAAGARLGPIRDARMGVLQVTPRHSTVVSDYGVNDNSSIEKQITAVVHASFAIR